MYYQGHGVFDWDTYNEEKEVPVVLTYKEFFLEDNAELNITDEEYERFKQGLNFDWAGFWDSREPVIDINEMEFDPNAVSIDYNADGSINESEYTNLNDLYQSAEIATLGGLDMDHYEFVDQLESGKLMFEYEEEDPEDFYHLNYDFGTVE